MVAEFVVNRTKPVEASKSNPCLHLWHPNFLALQQFPEPFAINRFGETPSPGEHCIIADPDIGELEIKAIAWKIRKVGGVAKVHGINQPLASLATCERAAGELGIQITTFALDFDDWLGRLEEQQLSPREAGEIAKVAIELLSGSEKASELASLRNRARLSAKEWSAIVDNLEREFQEELAARGIEYNPPGSDLSKTNLDKDAELLRLNIQRYIAEKDPIKRELLLKQFRTQGFSNKSIQAIATHLDRGNSTPKAKRFTPQELLSHNPDGLKWLFPGLLPASGISFLVAPPGAGKSTLAYDAAASVLLGESFLGEAPTTTGKVLIVVSDENLDYVQDKLISRGFYANMGCWELLYDWDVSQMDELEQALEDVRPQFVVVDSFASIHRNQEIDENSPQAANTIFKLNSLLERYSACGLCIHHANKNREQKGVNKVRGSGAIAAAASTVWLLEGEGNVKKFSTPKIRGGVQPINWEISLDIETGRFKVVSGNEGLEQCKPVIKRVKELFESSGSDRRLEIDEIQQLIGGGSKDSLRQAVSRLCTQGVLSKSPSKSDPRRRVYYLSPKYVIPTPPPPTDSTLLSQVMPEKHTVYSVDMCDKICDKEESICDNISENTPQNDTCHIPQPIDIQTVEQIPVTNAPIEGGEGSVTDNRKVAPDTGTESVFKINDRVKFVHPVTNQWTVGEVCRVSPNNDRIEIVSKIRKKTCTQWVGMSSVKLDLD